MKNRRNVEMRPTERKKDQYRLLTVNKEACDSNQNRRKRLSQTGKRRGKRRQREISAIVISRVWVFSLINRITWEGRAVSISFTALFQSQSTRSLVMGLWRASHKLFIIINNPEMFGDPDGITEGLEWRWRRMRRRRRGRRRRTISDQIKGRLVIGWRGKKVQWPLYSLILYPHFGTFQRFSQSRQSYSMSTLSCRIERSINRKD